MSFLSKLARFFGGARPAGRYYEFQVKCKRCGEILNGRVDLYNDPSLDYESGKTLYICRKVLMGSSHCYQQVEATFTFDENHRVRDRQIVGGEFMEA